MFPIFPTVGHLKSYRFIGLAYLSLKFCAAEFKQGRKSLGDNERSGRPNTATTDENIAKVHQMVLDDHRIKNIHGVVLIDYLQKGKTITGAYYASILDKLKAELAEKRPHLQKEKILLYQDNAPSHASAVAMAKIHELRFKLLDHPPYLPDLAPSDFFCSPN
ncbi:histone-lysine N-methyltransferase SETMAR [Trichonephila clavipes]|nr:histone-lysine N-methyltransferase SETMAR [Trichonephila clavipes]